MSKIVDAAAWAADMEEKAKLRQREHTPAAGVMVQLPFWPEPARGVPNPVLRSALFGAIQRGPRRYLRGEQIAALEGIEIRYTGERLDQGDLDVWETVLHIARLQEMGSQCRFTAYAMLKLLGIGDTGGNRDVLHKRLLRLMANAIEVKQGRITYIGSLIDEASKDEETGEYVVILNSKLRPLFGDDQFTQIDWQVRHALSGKPLAQWLHGFYASHAKPFPMSMDTLLSLSGSENADPYSARQTLQKALDALAEASCTNGQPFSYVVKDGLVHVTKEPNKTQQRHLIEKAKKPRSRKK